MGFHRVQRDTTKNTLLIQKVVKVVNLKLIEERIVWMIILNTSEG